MTATTIVLLLLSVLLAAGISYFQYFHKSVRGSGLRWLFGGLRFLSVLILLWLLINPRIQKTWYEEEKTPLAVVADNSESVTYLNSDRVAREVFDKLRKDSRLKEKFEIQSFRFDSETQTSDALDFKGRQTSVESVAKNLSAIYRNRKFPAILITDGNQTRGADYVHRFESGTAVFPVVLGDTTRQTDLRVSRINVNKYAFLKNKFPVETFVQYSGDKPVEANLEIRKGNTVVASRKVALSDAKRSAVVELLLPADKTGLQLYKAVVSALPSEKNTVNNAKSFVVEVMDQRTEVALVTSVNHPDIGALKRSIESNSQRKVTIVSPASQEDWGRFNVFVLYQPNSQFSHIFDRLASSDAGCLIISGMDTDFRLLNSKQTMIEFRTSSQPENYLPLFNEQFGLFAAEALPFEEFPPLEHPFGTIKASASVNELLSSSIRNVSTGAPLLGFGEDKGKRWGFVLGEGIWKWRLQSYLTLRSFESFDVFVDKWVQYLSTHNTRKSLVVNHESFYNSGDPVEITAQFFNKNYEFDEKARLNITLVHRASKKSRSFDLLRSGNAFKVNLDGIETGAYDFKVRELNSNASYSGYFELLDFDIEQQFVNPDLERLNQLAGISGGKTYLPDQTDALVSALLESPDYQTVEKEMTRRVPLIDSLWLLVALGVLLSAEWFLRKYHGML